MTNNDISHNTAMIKKAVDKVFEVKNAELTEVSEHFEAEN